MKFTHFQWHPKFAYLFIKKKQKLLAVTHNEYVWDFPLMHSDDINQ